MYLVGRTNLRGDARWTVNRLATELGLPGVAVAQIGSAMEKSGLLIVSEDDEFVPGRDIGRITIQEILEVARTQRSGHFAARGVEIPAVDRLSARLEAAWRECCAGRTLRDLIEDPLEPELVSESFSRDRQLRQQN
jgi:DNA-binding IscR family transcriptional regulator